MVYRHQGIARYIQGMDEVIQVGLSGMKARPGVLNTYNTAC